MPTTEQVAALIRARGDEERFTTIAQQMVAHERAASRHGVARRLEAALRAAPALRRVPLDLKGLFDTPARAPTSLDDVIMPFATRAEVARFVQEYRERKRIREAGLQPAHRILLCGPPGVGKTMTASAIAFELGLPIYRVALHSVIAQHLGETAGNLARVAEKVRATPAVFLFDEFDALGRARNVGDGSSAAAEMSRAANSLLMFFEEDIPGVVVAATNMPELLDPAVLRRFDARIVLSRPDADAVHEVLARRAAALGIAFGDSRWRCDDGIAPSHADLVVALEAAAKEALLDNRPPTRTDVWAHVRRRTEELRW